MWEQLIGEWEKKRTKKARWTQAFTPVPWRGHHRTPHVWFDGHRKMSIMIIVIIIIIIYHKKRKTGLRKANLNFWDYSDKRQQYLPLIHASRDRVPHSWCPIPLVENRYFEWDASKSTKQKTIRKRILPMKPYPCF